MTLTRQEVIDELNALITCDTSDNYDRAVADCMEIFKKYAFDEPQKVVVPKWFDEWVKKNTMSDTDKLDLAHCMVEDYNNGNFTNEQMHYVFRNPRDILSALLYGYEVEKEKRYYVDFGKGFYLERGYADRLSDISIYNSTKDWLTGDGKEFAIFTEAEIKAIDKRYWAFAVPVEEVGNE